jgi:LPS-assembly protein
MNATIDYENPLWHIDGLRHLLTPIVSYRYIPDANKDADWIPPIDRSTFTNYLPIMELGDMRALDQLQAENVLRVGINNTLQTRDKTYGSVDLVTLNVDEDFNFQRAPGTPDFSDLHADLTITPARWLELHLEDSVDPKTLTQQAVDTSVIIREGDIWSAKLGLGFLSDEYGTYAIPGLGSFPVVGPTSTTPRGGTASTRSTRRSFAVTSTSAPTSSSTSSMESPRRSRTPGSCSTPSSSPMGRTRGRVTSASTST